jgi:hypothetical protein
MNVKKKKKNETNIAELIRKKYIYRSERSDVFTGTVKWLYFKI